VWYPILGNFYILLNNAKYPFNIPEFRKAISLAMNRKAMWEVGGNPNINPYDASYNNPTMIPYPQQKEWIDPTLTYLATSLVEYNPQKAQDLLTSIGFKKNSAGQLCGLDGKPLPSYTFTTVSGWAAPLGAAQIFVQNMKEIGLSINISIVSFGSFYSSVQTGTYDISYMWESYGPTPYYTYNPTFNSAFTAPIGQTAISNFSRYTNPLIDE
ncbi:MAG: ABC transporter substrate-binding protein, partial [bacterium]